MAPPVYSPSPTNRRRRIFEQPTTAQEEHGIVQAGTDKAATYFGGFENQKGLGAFGLPTSGRIKRRRAKHQHRQRIKKRRRR